jgi:hypothetical protein
MDANLKLLLFVAVCNHETTVSMHDLYEQFEACIGDSYGNFTITKVVPKEKGKIHAQCHDENIGSLSISFRYKDRATNTYSKCNALVFKNSVRIASGIPKFLQDEVMETIDHKPLEEFARIVLDGLKHWSCGYLKTDEVVRLVNINAQAKLPPIFKFYKVCETLAKNDRYPIVYQPFFHERGAIATCHVYPYKERQCSAKIQHTGCIQYLGFQEMDVIHVFHEMIKQDLFVN